ncbi:MAG: uridine diphosphate-N-acetylglucosamine-binding protein YvcK [Candidatus Limnocylindrales bacterium]
MRHQLPVGLDSDGGRIARLRRLLRPGMGIKRWLLVIFVAELLVASAGALVLRQIYRDVAPGGPGDSPLLWLLTLQFLPLPLRPVALVAAGAAIFFFGLWRILGVLTEPLGRGRAPLVDLVYERRALARGPRIVAIGGGTGLSTLLRGLKTYSSNLTAIVTVADDGGSSGQLRTELGLPPMGDIRNCLTALSDSEATMTGLLRYRFPGDPADGGALAGHAVGNLLIAALSDIEGGFEAGVRRMNEVLAVRGRVVPAAPVAIDLHAELLDGSTVAGQSAISRARGIRRVWLTPRAARATPDALEAIAAADLVVLGPGSLFTSLLPSLLLPQIRDAVRSAAAPCLYVANVATQVGETEGYSLADHMDALVGHIGEGIVDVVLANDDLTARAPRDWPASPVAPSLPDAEARNLRLVSAPVVDPENAHHHDPARLAGAILGLYASGLHKAEAPLEAPADSLISA